MQNSKMESPILVVGMQRSGTSFLGQLMSNVEGCAYVNEPRVIWSFGNWFKSHDELTASDATSYIVKYIRRRFLRILVRQNASRLVEKTPSNCLRLRFIEMIYPKAKIIYVVRDPRGSILSTEKKFGNPISYKRFKVALETLSLVDLLGYTRVSIIKRILAKVCNFKINYWGIKPKNWQQLISSDQLTTLARQWNAVNNRALDDLSSSSFDYILVKYEDLSLRPDITLEKIKLFIGYPPNSYTPIDEYFKTNFSDSNVFSWKGLESVEHIKPLVSDCMKRLGYEW